MANLFANAAGTDFATAANWDTVTNTPTLHASTNIVVTANVYTATFTAPNTTNAVTGVAFLQGGGTNPTSETYTIALQGNSIDTTAVLVQDNTKWSDQTSLNARYVYFRFTVPYFFTTTTAGWYRFRISRTGSSTNLALCADSGGANPLFMCTIDAHAAPTTTDNIWIGGSNGTGTSSIISAGTQTIGVGTDVTGVGPRTIGSACTIFQGGNLSLDTVSSATLTLKGNMVVYGSSYNKGSFNQGSIVTPYPSANTAQLLFNENSVQYNYGLETYTQGQVIRHGTEKVRTTTYVSGNGTTATPLVVTDPNLFAVNDEIIVGASSNNAGNYGESETKFIKTIVSSTSYTLSNTSAGVEAGLTYAHTNGIISNLQCNVITGTTNTTYGYYEFHSITVPNDNYSNNVRFIMGTNNGNNANKGGVMVERGAGQYASFNYCVFTDGGYGNLWFQFTSTAETFTGLIFARTANLSDMYMSNVNNKTFTGCITYSTRTHTYMSSCSLITFNNNICIGGANNSGTPYGSYYLLLCFGITFNACEAHCSRGYGFVFAGSMAAITFNSCLFGTKGYNQTGDINSGANYQIALFSNCTFGSPLFVTNGLTMLTTDSMLKFDTLNTTTNNHYWYENGGYFRSTGAGLANTTVHTAGGLGLESVSQETNNGNKWIISQPIGNIQGKDAALQIYCYIQSASYLAGVYTMPQVTINYDNGTITTVQATQTVGSWQKILVPFTPATTYPIVTITLQTKTDAASEATSGVIWDDVSFFYPPGYQLSLGSLDLWANSQPVTPFITTGVSAKDVSAAVWDELTANHSVTGSYGVKVRGLKNANIVLDGEIIG